MTIKDLGKQGTAGYATSIPGYRVRGADDSWMNAIRANNPPSYLPYLGRQPMGAWVDACEDNNPWGWPPCLNPQGPAD